MTPFQNEVAAVLNSASELANTGMVLQLEKDWWVATTIGRVNNKLFNTIIRLFLFLLVFSFTNHFLTDIFTCQAFAFLQPPWLGCQSIRAIATDCERWLHPWKWAGFPTEIWRLQCVPSRHRGRPIQPNRYC